MMISSVLTLAIGIVLVVLVLVFLPAIKRAFRKNNHDYATDFSRVEAEFEKLRAQFEAGALTEEEFKAQLEELMIQDEQGRWWMIGYETGQWYYHDGEKWVRGEPPSPAPVAPLAPVVEFWGPVLLMSLGWGISWAISWGYAAEISDPYLRAIYFMRAAGPMATVCGALSGLISGLILRLARPAIGWRQMLLIVTGWTVGSTMAVFFPYEIYQTSPSSVGLLWLAIGGSIGGLAIGLALRWVHPAISWQQVFTIAAGWTIGMSVGSAIAVTAIPEFDYGAPTLVTRSILAGIIIGAIGGAVTCWQLKEIDGRDHGVRPS